MNTLQLNPTDVLFFRDGRPMDGGAGHGAAWPMPHVINAAFHAALHRADIAGVHEHRIGRSSDRENQTRDKKFGSLVTVGPFPVDKNGQWYFPRPADAQQKASATPTLLPLSEGANASSLDDKLLPVVNGRPPSKDKVAPWMSGEAWQAYLDGKECKEAGHYVEDADISAAEHQIGIAIDPESGTTVDGKFYSASYLRLKSGWKLGVLAEALDKTKKGSPEKRDLILSLLDDEKHLIVGGQQRICTAAILNSPNPPLPVAQKISGTRVKWTLLSPAVFPIIGKHTGGWLPSWIDKDSYEVQLLDGPGKNKAKRMGINQGQPIKAKLVSTIIPRSIPITGWAIAGEKVGAKSSHLAVPAGAVYYFEADNGEQAQKLADALNWHGQVSETTTITNRRSTLFGEKGFGLGVCSDWRSYEKTTT